MFFWKKRNSNKKEPSSSNANRLEGGDSAASTGPHTVIVRDAGAPRVAPAKKNPTGLPPGGKTLEEA